MINRSVLLFLSITFLCVSGHSQTFPVVTDYVAPVYPAVARAVRATGLVYVGIEVNDAGKVISANAVSGHPLLRRSAELASVQWRFSSLPGRHFLLLRFTYKILERAKSDQSVPTGPYSFDVIPLPVRLDYSVSYSAK
jgi:TonB family protein